MATKRPPGPDLVSNPFIKKRNLEWALEIPSSPTTGVNHTAEDSDNTPGELQGGKPPTDKHVQEIVPSTSAVEAGKAQIRDHLGYFSSRLGSSTASPYPGDAPRLSIEEYRRLYEENSGSARGAHFVIHQHDHPIAGTHYDLRLQINATSSASWAIMYGLPGDPNSVRLNRNATETRIHCLWNHLVETASESTGSLLIWDTGTYSILPHSASLRHGYTTDSHSSLSDAGDDDNEKPTEQQKLHQAFQARKIRLRLHGARLPDPYILHLRLTKTEDVAGRQRSSRAATTGRRRRRRGGGGGSRTPASKRSRTATRAAARYYETTSSSSSSSSSSSDSNSDNDDNNNNDGDENEDGTVVPPSSYSSHKGDDDEGEEEQQQTTPELSPTEREIRELEDDEVRRTNAYPGADNSIGSVHQRRWYVSLDREGSGFVRSEGGRKREQKKGVVWQRRRRTEGHKKRDGDGSDGSRLAYPFYVRGAEVERSLITGRRGADVLRDEGVVGYVGRKGWRALLN
ncbi:DNA polymerase ligase-domain-containing protein [Xylariomycetidae sp. FL2044]|nr:DNA polymerase ligase-domain-containing protein [Xylariomycetidae sp. FL2044]